MKIFLKIYLLVDFFWNLQRVEVENALISSNIANSKQKFGSKDLEIMLFLRTMFLFL